MLRHTTLIFDTCINRVNTAIIARSELNRSLGDVLKSASEHTQRWRTNNGSRLGDNRGYRIQKTIATQNPRTRPNLNEKRKARRRRPGGNRKAAQRINKGSSTDSTSHRHPHGRRFLLSARQTKPRYRNQLLKAARACTHTDTHTHRHKRFERQYPPEWRFPTAGWKKNEPVQAGTGRGRSSRGARKAQEIGAAIGHAKSARAQIPVRPPPRSGVASH